MNIKITMDRLPTRTGYMAKASMSELAIYSLTFTIVLPCMLNPLKLRNNKQEQANQWLTRQITSGIPSYIIYEIT